MQNVFNGMTYRCRTCQNADEHSFSITNVVANNNHNTGKKMSDSSRTNLSSRNRAVHFNNH